MDVERWQRLSPMLDVLLELGPRAREARLDALRVQDADMAAELDKLLALEAHDDALFDRSLHEAPAASSQTGQRMGPYRMDAVLGEGDELVFVPPVSGG